MLIENLLGEEKSIEILFKHFCIPLVIQSANDITVNNLVFWRTINSKLPDILTTPVILRSPTEGKSLLSAKPGLRGFYSINILPTFWTFPKEESIAII